MITISNDFLSKFGIDTDGMVFIYILLRSSDEGIYINTVRDLSQLLGYKFATVKAALKQLEADRYISVAGNLTSKVVITITDYAKYCKRNPKPLKEKAPIIAPGSDSERESLFATRMMEVYPNVAKMKQSLTRAEWDSLIDKGYTTEQITHVLSCMENYKPLNKKYVSCYLTLSNWLRREYR